MKRRGVFAVIAGHFHRDELHVIDGLPFYLAGPVINFWGRQTTYRHWTLANGVLSYRTIYLELWIRDRDSTMHNRLPSEP